MKCKHCGKETQSIQTLNVSDEAEYCTKCRVMYQEQYIEDNDEHENLMDYVGE